MTQQRTLTKLSLRDLINTLVAPLFLFIFCAPQELIALEVTLVDCLRLAQNKSETIVISVDQINQTFFRA